MVSTIVDLKARVVTLEHLVGDILKVNDAQQALIVTQRSQLLGQQLQIDSVNASLEKVLKQLAAYGESSCRQETVILAYDDNVDPEGAHGGDEQPIASSMPSVSLAEDSNVQGESGGDGDKGEDKQVDVETIECLIDLDIVEFDDRESEAEDVEIECKQDDEGVKYVTHEGVEFDTLFIDQISDLVPEDIEEREIIEDVEKEGKSTEKSSDPSVDLSKDDLV
ncbi:hypothetical protein L1987_32451 [Smallanthus sonchifolius]|uniref:Uncharacterized protein n=1 Tax=Smallanthus sonchifolius TaxID=185202 RepID=A0ACB9HN15_9ASTR|nr:hypothetical protein L1987_32451 [Smallanthus sonchifolius]